MEIRQGNGGGGCFGVRQTPFCELLPDSGPSLRESIGRTLGAVYNWYCGGFCGFRLPSFSGGFRGFQAACFGLGSLKTAVAAIPACMGTVLFGSRRFCGL